MSYNNQDQTALDTTTIVVQGQSTASREERGHQLVVTEGADMGRVIDLSGRALTIGRLPPAELVLTDHLISRNHCRISMDGGAPVVADLNSTNGTFVDGQRLDSPLRLTEGCIITVGRHQLKYERHTRREIESKRDFERSLDGASRYVQSMLPPPIMDGPVRTEWLLVPCARLGGDALGYQWIDNDHFALYLLDVSGHGPEAAMLAVGVMNALRQKLLPGANLRDAGEVVRQLNAMFQMEDHAQMYFTLWYGVYQLSTRILQYCSAGQHPAYLVHEGTAAPQPLRTANPPVGVLPAPTFKSATFAVPADAMLYMFSDGAFEIETASGRRQELEDMVPMLIRGELSGLTETQRIYRSVQDAARQSRLEDDFSLLVTTFK